MSCPNCSTAIPAHVDRCVACGIDVGFPNVRGAQHPDELSELRRRVASAEDRAAARGCAQTVHDFRSELEDSHAVMCCSLAVLQNVVSSDNQLFATYYQLVRSEQRLPEANVFDQGRQSVDALLFPDYFDKIQFAALTLNERGLTGYGPCSVVFQDGAIEKRASVFWDNSFLMLQRLRVVVGTTVPRGYRADWQRRADLAIAKLADKLSQATQPSDFPRILLRASANRDQDEFVEVHIYGPLHRRSIRKVAGRLPKRKQDRIIVEDIERKLAQINVELELDP